MNELADGLWQVTGADFRMPGGVLMPLSATVIRLPDRSLVVTAPIDFSVAQVAAIDAAGEVAHVVAPNLFHHMYLPAAAKRWPRAQIHAPAGLAAKRADVTLHRELGKDHDAAWRDALDVEVIDGVPKMTEAVLFHRASGTLVVADLLFHVTAPANLRTKLVMAMMGTGGKQLAQSRLWGVLVKDRAAARRSVDRVLEWGIRGVALAHGPAVELSAAELAPKLGRVYRGAPRLPSEIGGAPAT